MASLIVFVIGLVVGSFFPNYIKPKAVELWGKIKNAVSPPDAP